MRKKLSLKILTVLLVAATALVYSDSAFQSSLAFGSGGSDLVSSGPPESSKSGPTKASIPNHDWPAYGGAPDGDHYSTLSQINRRNVGHLQQAWTFDTGETGGLQTSPIEVDGVLFGITPTQKVFALDAATGKLIWKFDSGIKSNQPNRGLCYWRAHASVRQKLGQVPALQKEPDSRILVGVMNYLYALDAKTGQPIPAFGKNGRIDLREGLGRDPEKQSIALTSPGVIYEDLIIVGGRDPETLPAPPGDIRAYDVRTGELRWSFHTIPHPGEFGYDTWPRDAWKYIGAANNWAGMSVDAKRGIVYVPTGSAAFDFYGGNRIGDDLFANCLVALDARTGERIWHFQGVKHDLWDRDFPSPPALVTVKRHGRKIDAVAQTSKQGFVYLFDRVNGAPLFALQKKSYPASDVPGEVTASVQSLPIKPAPFARQSLTEDMLTNRTPEAHQWALDQFRKFRNGGRFKPFGVGVDTVVFPGFDGGAEWGGPAIDPRTAVIYINSNEMAWTGALTKNLHETGPRSIYSSQCAVCHGEDMSGSPPAIPSLAGLGGRLTANQVETTIRFGKGRMPGFTNLTDEQVYALAAFLVHGEAKDSKKEMTGSQPSRPDPMTEMKYLFTGYHRFLDQDHYPAIAPPWGTLNAIDLNTGQYLWKINLGEYPELAAQGMTDTGSDNYGGPIVTAGGLLFIGATNYDKKFRAFDKSTGKLLWETTLPFAGNATPITYVVNGRQYVVIAAGGGKDPKSPSGGVYVAFALPNNPNAQYKQSKPRREARSR